MTFTPVIVPEVQTKQEKAITAMLVEEVGRRIASGRMASVEMTPLSIGLNHGDGVMLATRSQMPALLPPELRRAWQAALSSLHPTEHPEAFSVISLGVGSENITIIAGNDERGELFGAGWLLRHMSFAGAVPQVPRGVRIFSSPEKSVRGQQIGYRAKNNTYDAWNLAQFEEQIRELAIFGNNTIQVISPNSDDAASSPLFPAPSFETVVGISAILDKYGLDCDLYYPEMRKNYSDASAVEAELKDFEALVRAMPRVDSIHIPGGDPGSTPPAVLFSLVAREVVVLHRYHPAARVWVSAQGFDRTSYDAFYRLLDGHPHWLTGVFFGPQSRESFFKQRQRIPTQFEMQFYPDIAHTMHAQFPVPQWDPIFALTEGREPICPRPVAFASIYRRFNDLNTGFIAYSEGVNDDVNKIVMDQLGWSSKTSVDAILAEYARFFLHREGAQQALAVSVIRGLEKNWNGPLDSNHQIPITLRGVETLERESTPSQTQHNGRWESLVYRANYDDYLQRRLLRERTAEAQALLALASNGSSAQSVAEARDALAATKPDAEETREHEVLFATAGLLFRDFGLQLSVPLYGASNWERGANLDRVDTPLNDAAWLNESMNAALALPNEAERRAALAAILHWQRPTDGALYDDLGDPTAEPHLVRVTKWQDDPEMYRSAIDGIADRTLQASDTGDAWRLSWITYAETLYETPLELHYSRLSPHVEYRVRITYAGEDYALPLRLVAISANRIIEIHPARLRHANPETVEFSVPRRATSSGSLTLQWTGPTGSGGSGRGRQIAEVWLIPSLKSALVN